MVVDRELMWLMPLVPRDVATLACQYPDVGAKSRQQGHRGRDRSPSECDIHMRDASYLNSLKFDT